MSSSTISRRTRPKVDRFLAEHPQVRFHFTPTYSSWLNQVELLFAKIQRERRSPVSTPADGSSPQTYQRTQRTATVTGRLARPATVRTISTAPPGATSAGITAFT